MTVEDIATKHMGLVSAQLLEVVPLAATQETLSRHRLERDLDLSLLPVGTSRATLTGVAAAFAEYDRLIDALVRDAMRRQQPVPKGLVDKLGQLLEKKVRESLGEAHTWLGVWVAGAALGLVTIVAAFSWSSGSDDSGWEWITLCLAGLGALVAGLYTFRGATDLNPLTRWLLLALPLVVLVVAATLPQGGTDDLPAAKVVVAATAVALLGGLSLWIVLSEPGRRIPQSARMVVPLERLLVTEPGETSAGSRRPLIKAELDELLARVEQEATSQRVQGRRWAATFIVVGGLAASLSGAAGVTATQADAESPWVIGLAVSGAGLTALMTALNPGGRWEQARTVRLACESLAQEVGVFVRVDLGTTPDDSVGRMKIDEIALKYDALLGVPERARLDPVPITDTPPSK